MDIIEIPIEHKIIIRSPRERVFNAIATGKGLDQWFTKGSSVDVFEGGKIRFVWRDWGADHVDTEAEGPVLEYNAPERFVFKWWSTNPSTVEFDFKVIPEGTMVILKEHGYENSREGMDRCIECAIGWGQALTLMKFYLEHGVTY